MSRERIPEKNFFIWVNYVWHKHERFREQEAHSGKSILITIDTAKITDRI
jgi:hypothetical protein